VDEREEADLNLEQADAALAAYLVANWTATPIAWENVEARGWTTAGQPLLPEGTADFIAVQLYPVADIQITVPGTCHRTAVAVQIAVCVKAGTGSRIAKRHLSSLVALLGNLTLPTANGDLRISNMTGSGGYLAENGWYVMEAAFAGHFERFTPQP
jgi:hypothetical protein